MKKTTGAQTMDEWKERMKVIYEFLGEPLPDLDRPYTIEDCRAEFGDNPSWLTEYIGPRNK